MQLALDAVLICLLAATLVHALRLERALGVLRRDRAELESMIARFDTAAHTAEQSVEKLRAGAESTGQTLSRQIDRAGALCEDLVFLAERADRAADRLEQQVRAGKPLSGASLPLPQMPPEPPPPVSADPVEPALSVSDGYSAGAFRSQAERDLLQALRRSRVSAHPTAEAG